MLRLYLMRLHGILTNFECIHHDNLMHMIGYDDKFIR